MSPNDTIISRIQKLLEMAKRGTEHEASVAAGLVQKLLAEYNLEMAEVESASVGKVGKDAPGGKREKKTHNKSAMYSYQRNLMASVAQNNFCHHMIDKTFRIDPKGSKPRWYWVSNSTPENRNDIGRTHVLIGRDVNVASAQIMYDYLIETMDRLLPWQGMEKRGKNALLWLDACATRLADRLTERRYEMQAAEEKARRERPQESGIVLASVFATEDDYNNDIRCGVPLGTHAEERRKRIADSEAANRRQEELVAGWDGCRGSMVRSPWSPPPRPRTA